MIWKIWKKGMSNSEKIWKIQKKIGKDMKNMDNMEEKYFFPYCSVKTPHKELSLYFNIILAHTEL
jgi:hypothetical protein